MVQRYRPDSDEQGRSFEMIPDDGGDYVAYEDYEELEAEVGRLQLMNPCNHTGFESAPCDVCGYPDPRKLIAKLKEENQRLREALERIAAYDSYHSEWPTEIWINAHPEELAHVILSGGKYPPQQTHVGGKL